MKTLTKIFLFFLLTSCANIVAPTGGDKDLDPPKLLKISAIENPKNMHYKSIMFEFDEYIQLNKWEEYFYISPPLKNRIQKKIKGQTLYITIEDTLNQSTNYYIALNSCIRDNNEGNVLDTLNYELLNSDSSEAIILSGNLKDAYTLSALENAWVMLFNEEVNDTIIFRGTPNYIARTDKKGIFHFPNLKAKNYKIAALTGFDFIYNKEEKVAFLDSLVNAKTDSFISLFAFNPIITIDSTLTNPIELKLDSITSSAIDSVVKTEKFPTGKLEIITNKNSSCIFQLLQNEKVITEIWFAKKPYLIDEIVAGKYQLKYIADRNQDSIWNTGSWEKRVQPEEVLNYHSEITIRSNWDLELEWIIQE